MLCLIKNTKISAWCLAHHLVSDMKCSAVLQIKFNDLFQKSILSSYPMCSRKRVMQKRLLEDALSIFIEQEICIGEYTLTYLYWYEEREELSKFVNDSQSTDQKSLLPIKIPVLMLYPDKFVVRSTGKLIRKNIELDHFECVASILGQVLKLDWIQTIGAFSEDGLCI